jgi:hypothetical protein
LPYPNHAVRKVFPVGALHPGKGRAILRLTRHLKGMMLSPDDPPSPTFHLPPVGPYLASRNLLCQYSMPHPGVLLTLPAVLPTFPLTSRSILRGWMILPSPLPLPRRHRMPRPSCFKILILAFHLQTCRQSQQRHGMVTNF